MGADRFKILSVNHEDGVGWAHIEMIRDKDADTMPLRMQDAYTRQLRKNLTKYLSLTADRFRPEFVKTRITNLESKKDLFSIGFAAAAYLDIVNVEK